MVCESCGEEITDIRHVAWVDGEPRRMKIRNV